MATEAQNHPIMSNRDLELPADRMRELVDRTLDRIVDHISSLDRQPSADVEGCEALARSLVEPLPERPAEYEALLDLLFKELVPKSFNTAGPGYLAYIPGGGLFHSAVADLISDAVNRYVGVWIAAPGLAQLEANVIRWFSAIVGYPHEARGILTTGGSLANFTALVTARRNLLPDNFLSGILYASDQVHHSVVKAAMLAGFPAGNVREIATDDAYRIRLDHLETSIEADRRGGKNPFLVVGNAGTTNTGAVDDLDALANLAARQNVWLHIDAAYGGFFMLTGKGREVMRGIERAHSITLDPHKGLFLPYGTGSLLVREGDALRRAHAVDASYLPPMQQDSDLVDFCLYSPELSRDFRGLRVWLPIKMHGIEPFRRNLEEKLELAAWAADELRSIPSVEIVAEPQLSLVAFRVALSGCDTETENEFNRRLLQGVNARKRVYLTGTTLRGRFVIRICVLSFRTHFDRMKAALEDIRASLLDLR
jgi:aromatic-L-amino-acid decarboxylase